MLVKDCRSNVCFIFSTYEQAISCALGGDKACMKVIFTTNPIDFQHLFDEMRAFQVFAIDTVDVHISESRIFVWS